MPSVEVDSYVIDILLPDLVGHDRQPSAFLVYLFLWRRSHESGRMKTNDGVPARLELEQLKAELEQERAIAIERGAVDREWFQKTVRWLVEWVPDSELTLIAALGQIVRASPPTLRNETLP